MSDNIKTAQLFNCTTPYIMPLLSDSIYPWEILSKIKTYIQHLLSNCPEDFTLYAENVLIGKDVKIDENVKIEAPAVIGSCCELRHGAYIRGNVIIGRECVIGNSSELKNCVLLDCVQVPHYNYIGDSILGNFAHMGAGAVLSNLKSDKSNVVVKGKEQYETGLRKFGAILGDGADIGCGCVLNPGTIVGKNTSVYPLTSLRGVIPADSIVKSKDDIVKKRTVI